MMNQGKGVHKEPRPKRVARGVRMDATLWEFVDDLAAMVTDGNSSRLIEKWAREKRDAVMDAS